LQVGRTTVHGLTGQLVLGEFPASSNTRAALACTPIPGVCPTQHNTPPPCTQYRACVPSSPTHHHLAPTTGCVPQHTTPPPPQHHPSTQHPVLGVCPSTPHHHHPSTTQRPAGLDDPAGLGRCVRRCAAAFPIRAGPGAWGGWRLGSCGWMGNRCIETENGPG
jgi:hypothetical protein